MRLFPGLFHFHVNLLLAILVCNSISLAAEPEAKVVCESPRLSELATAIQAGATDAVSTFWGECKQIGTPLVEPIPGQNDQVWVTFVYGGDIDTKNVVLNGTIAKEQPADNRLQRLLDTDIWYVTRRARHDLRGNYSFTVNDPALLDDDGDANERARRSTRIRKDPFNAKRNVNGSILELAKAPPQPWIEKNAEAPPGTLHMENIHSVILNNDRRISVYRPASYDPQAAAYPLAVIFDLDAYTTLVPTPTILNNMIHAGAIPPVVAVLVGNASGARNRELPCNDDFARFLAVELLPWVRQRHHVTSQPEKVVVAGSSFGGLAATYFAFKYPQLAGNVLSQSGSYWWSPEGGAKQDDPACEKEWLTRQFALAPRQPIRFFLEAGLHESLLADNRHFRTVLEAKGYDIVRYAEFNGGHDYFCWRGSLSDGLIALLGTAETPLQSPPAAED